MATREDEETGYSTKELDRWAKRGKAWGKRGDAFIYVISGAKIRNPAAAQALIERLGGRPETSPLNLTPRAHEIRPGCHKLDPRLHARSLCMGTLALRRGFEEIGRASCREKVGHEGWIMGVRG